MRPRPRNANMNAKKNDEEEMLEEYDFTGGVRGK